MIPILAILGGLYLAATIAFLRAAKRAPSGFEDEEGFHLDEERRIAGVGRSASPATVRVHRKPTRTKPARLTPHARGC